MGVVSPQLRKAAQGGVVSMLRDGTSSGDFHPAASLTVRHCRHVLSLGGEPCWRAVSESCCERVLCAGVETTRLHVLGLLRDCLANIPTQVHAELHVALTRWALWAHGPLWFWHSASVMSLLISST